MLIAKEPILGLLLLLPITIADYFDFDEWKCVAHQQGTQTLSAVAATASTSSTLMIMTAAP